MKLFKTLLLLSVLGSLVFSGCKKDEEPEINYPITLNYQNTVNDTGVKAFEKQNGAFVEISAAPYEADPEFAISEVDNINKIVLLSETTGEIHNGTTSYDATYTVSNGAYKFSFTEPTLNEVVTHTASGSDTKLNSHGLIVSFIDTVGSVTISGLCGEIGGTELLPCIAGSEVEAAYSADLDDGEILVYRTFDFVYE